MNIREISDALHINRNSVAKYLDVLASREEIEFKFFGKSKVYFLSQHVPISTLMKFSSHLMLILNRDLQVVQINDAFLRYLERSRESVIGARVHDLQCNRLMNDSVISWCTKSLQGGEITDEICISTDRSSQYFSVVLTPTRFPDNTPGTIIFFEEITERKRAEDLLRKSEEKYRRIVETANEGVWAIDRHSVTTFVNQKILDILGYSAGEMIGKESTAFMSPDELEDNTTRMRNRAEGKKEVYERCLIKKDGSTCWVLISVTPLMDPDGNFAGSFAMMTDITQRKLAEQAIRESEKRFEQVADNVNSWIWEVDSQGLYLYSSSAIERILGYTPEEIVGKMHFFDLFDPSVRDELFRQTHAAFAKHEAFSGFINPARHKNGKIVILETSGSAVYNCSGRFTGYRGSDSDITEHQNMEIARQAALDQIEKNIGQFAQLGDQIRNPLTAILAYAGTLPPEAEAKIDAQVREIDRIVSRMDQAWIESEKVRAHLKRYYDITLPTKTARREEAVSSQSRSSTQ
jgi:PAS domain S-box-containing protein